MKTLFTLGAAVAACGAMIVAQQTRAQQRPTGPYTFEQALAGREAYLANCAACHATDLSGREGPQLAGGTFMNQWGDRTARELISFMRASMPPGAGWFPLLAPSCIAQLHTRRRSLTFWAVSWFRGL